MRLLLDTNILIDYYARRAPFANDAVKLRCASYFGDVELWACSQSLADVEYVLRRAIPPNTPRSMMLESLDFLNIASPTAADMRDALASDWPDLEDFLVARAAQRVQADFVITRDERGFAQAKTPVLSPAAFLSMMKERFGVEYDDIAW